MKQRLPLILSVVGLVLYGATAVASATTARPGSLTHGHYCVAEAVPAGSSRTATVTCYPSFAESIRAATGGRVRLPASARPGSVTPDEINAADIPATTYVLGIDYAHTNYGLPSLTLYQSSKCGYFQLSSMPSGWNDVVSSVSTNSGCASTLWQNINFGGSTFRVGRNTAVATLGSFNDQASSQRWCPAYPCT